MQVALTRLDHLGALILGAFRPASHATGRFSLAIMRHDDVPVLPNLEWARPWIDSGREVPGYLAYPYRILFDRVVGVVHVLDQRDGRAAIWVRHEADLDLRSFITPFRIMLSWMANLVNAEVIHASAAVVDGRAIAFSGASGSGKSTLALALGRAGHPLIADDCLLVEDGHLHAIYSRAKVDAGSQSLLGLTDEQVVVLADTPRAKRLLPLDAAVIALTGSAPLAAWGMPALGSRAGSYALPRRQAHRMLATDSLREVIGGRTRNHLRLARLSATYPAFRLMLTPAMNENIDTVRGVVAGIANASEEGVLHGV